MAVLALFILAILFCIAAARYNNSDKLFWVLFISLVGAFTAGSVARAFMEDKTEKRTVVIEKAPTQVLDSMPYNSCTLADMSISATQVEKSAKPVGKDSLLNENDSLLSVCHVETRGQPWCMYFDDS